MRQVQILWFSFFLALSSCTGPMDGDFGFQQLGLADDEFLWVLRIYRGADGPPMSQPHSNLDSLEIEQFNSPIFTMALPLIIRDLLSDSLQGYEDYEFFEEEKEIHDLSERLVKLGVNRQNFSPLLKSCDLLMIVKSGKGKKRFTPKFLRLVWHDPTGRLPERNLACVKFSDIEQKNYTLEIKGQTLAFSKVLSELKYHYFPVHIRTNKAEYSIQSLEEAQYLNKMVLSGNWDKVDFIDESINISGVQKTFSNPKILQSYTGVYLVKADSNSTAKKTLYLTLERDYLVADWVHRSRPEKVYPFYENAYFSPRGEFYLFPESADSIEQTIRFVSQGDTLTGKRIQQINQ